jgi:hypothetical protein
MPEEPRTVFISFGQSSEEEKALGQQVCGLVHELTPFVGYFAQNQVSLEMLSRNVLNRLYESVGLIAIMHHRGLVAHHHDFEQMQDGRGIIRASVWIEQEIAIAALMQQVLHRPLHVALFLQHGIEIEGIRKQLHLNPIEFKTAKEVLSRLREILPHWKEPLYMDDNEVRKQAESVELSIKVLRGWNLTITVDIRNLSETSVDIKSIALRGQNARLCDPVYPPQSASWTLHPQAGFSIQLMTNEDVGQRLIGIYGRQRTALPADAVFSPANRFSAMLTVELRCEILGIERSIKEDCSVQINLTTAEINGL